MDNNTLILVNLPRMIVSEEDRLETVSSMAELGTVFSLTSSLFINSLLGLSLNLLWSCLNSVQMMVKLQFLKTKFPATADLFNRPMI